MLHQREKLLPFNQKYWGKFRRKEWLVNGDRNSQFFSATSKHKKEKETSLQNKG